jgi:PAS domain S-box-containing protein
MTKKQPRTDNYADLRRRAEEKAHTDEAQARKPLSPKESGRLLHELQVHQIELEMQNEELRRAQGELEAARARYFDLFDLAPVGYFTLSEQGLILEVNLTAAGLLGVERRDLVKKPLTRFVLPEDQDIYFQHRKQLLETGTPQVYDLRVLRADAAPFWVRWETTEAHDADGAPVCRAVMSDITARKQAEETLAELDHRKDQFLAMLSHELRNPLAPILNSVQLLQLQKGQSSVQQKALAIIERQVGQLTHLVGDLLEVSRAITGKIQLCQEQVAVSNIVERAVETARPLIDQRKHELTVSLPPDPVWLYADAARLEQVLTNLLTNAAKYSKVGGHIWLSAQQEGDKVVLRVRDTGLGIAPAFLPHVFELFTQAERLSDRRQGGLGIGLTLAKRLVEMHGGTIGVSSTLGQGSEFVVSLVVCPPGTISGRAGLPGTGKACGWQPPPTEIAKPTESALRVLVVDDNLDAANALKMLVEEAGHLVRMAYTGPTALAAALDDPPDVMLLDIGLPELDGLEVAKRIRQEPLLRDIVLVAVTGYRQAADRQRVLEAGFDHYLVKPADFEKVRQILAEVTEKAT